MAALNYTIKLTDTGDNGSGPYTAVVFKNPTTDASGGTTLVTLTNTGTVINPVELVAIAQGWISDNIAAANQSDTLN